MGHSSHSLLDAPYTILKCLLGGHKRLPDTTHCEGDVKPAPETYGSINGPL